MTDLVVGIGVLRKVISHLSEQPGNRSKTVGEGPEKFNRELISVLERFQLITKLDELWNADVAFGRLIYHLSDEEEITGYYRDWLLLAEPMAVELESYRTAGSTFSQAAEFSSSLEDARGICTPDEVFFSGPKLEALRDRAVSAYYAGETEEIRDPRS